MKDPGPTEGEEISSQTSWLQGGRQGRKLAGFKEEALRSLQSVSFSLPGACAPTLQHGLLRRTCCRPRSDDTGNLQE